MILLLKFICYTILIFIKLADSDSLLTQEQRNWLLGISRDNISVGNVFPSINNDQLEQLNIKNDLFVNDTTNYHLPYRYANDIIFSDYNKTNIVEYNDCGDSAFWTAHYVGYLVHRWNITKDPNILNEIYNEIFAYYNLLTCAERTGYMVRMLGLSNDTSYQLYYNGFKSHYNCSNNPNYVWLGHSERDQYIGGAMMLTVIWTRLYSTSNDKINIIRSMAYNISELIINDLYSHDWWIVNSLPDNDPPVNPDAMFKCIWMRLGMSINPNKYVPLFENEYNKKFKESVETFQMDISNIYHSSYFANNLCTLVVSILGYLETDIQKLIIIFNHLQNNAVNKGKYHIQATYSAWFLSALEGHQNEIDKLNITQTNLNISIGILKGTLLDFPDNKWDKYVNQNSNPLYYPHHNNEMSKYALLPYDRPYDTYMWQRSPAILSGGSNIPQQYQMTDFLLPYWIAKYVKIL